MESRTLLSGTGVVRGSVWYDLNGNGVWDSNERPVADRVVYLDENSNGNREEYELSARTNAAGFYEITQVEAKTYVARQELPAGWSQTYPTTGQGPNVLVANQHEYGNRVLEYTHSGDLVRTIAVPPKSPEAVNTLRDLSVDAAGQILVEQFGYYGNYISKYTPSLGTWEHQNDGGVVYTGRDNISTLGNLLYQSSTRINIHDWTWEYFDTVPGIVDDFVLGLDGYLYGWHANPWGMPHVWILNPTDYSTVRDFDIANLNGHRFNLWAVAGDRNGDIFAADETGQIYHYDNTGHMIDSGLGSPHPIDLAVSTDGYVAVGHTTGDVDIFAPDLTRVANFNLGNSNWTVVAFSGYREEQPGVMKLEQGQLVEPLNLGTRMDSSNVTLSLSQNQVNENSANGTVVGLISSGGDFHAPVSISLVDSAQGRFALLGNNLQVADGTRLNYEATQSYYVTVRAVDYYGVSLDKAFRIDLLDVNEPPTANIGGPYSLRDGTSIELNGTGSDPDQSSNTLVYQWDLDDDEIFGESGSAAARGDELGRQPIFRAVGLAAPTVYPISFRVADSSGLSNTVTTNVRVDENLPPTADAGGPYQVRKDRNVTVDGGNSSDPERPADTLIYEWDLDLDGIFGETGLSAFHGDEVGLRPVFSPAGLVAPTTVTVSLRVTDDVGATDIGSAEIQVVKNETPNAVAGGPYRVLEGRTVTLDASGSSDPEDSSTLIYEWDLDADGVFAEVGGAAQCGDEIGIQPVFSAATLVAPRTLQPTLRVTDDGGLTDLATFDVLVASNESPTAEAGGPYSVVYGNSISLDGRNSHDLDQAPDTLIYQWDLDNDGVFGETGPSATRGDEIGAQPIFSAAALTDRASLTIGLKVTDDGPLTNQTTATIHVARPTDPRVSAGELVVTGSGGADVITISITGTPTVIEVKLAGESFQFPLTDVTSYFVDAGAGNDSVTVAESITLDGRILGGLGNDSLTGGGGDEEINGGDGNDRIGGGSGDDSLQGEDGDDALLASRGHDRLNPGPGRNSFQTGPLSSSIQSISVSAAITNTKKGRKGSSGPNVSGQINASLDTSTSGSVSVYLTNQDVGTIDGHLCSATLSVSSSGNVTRLKYRTNASGTVQVSCSGFGDFTGTVTGLVSGTVSLQQGMVSTKGNLRVSFGSGRPARSSMGGSSPIDELITDIL